MCNGHVEGSQRSYDRWGGGGARGGGGGARVGGEEGGLATLGLPGQPF